MSEQTKDVREQLVLTMWLEKRAATPDIAARSAETIRFLSARLSKAQVEDCRRDMERRMATNQSPTLVFSDGAGGTVRMDANAARTVVLDGACGSPKDYDLVLGVAAFGVLAAVCDRLTTQASQMYYDALRTKVDAEIRSSPLAQRYLTRFKAAEALQGRARDRAMAKLQDDRIQDHAVVTRALDKKIERDLAVRVAASVGIVVGSNRHASPHLN